MPRSLYVSAALLLASVAHAKVFLHEPFDDDSAWTTSSSKSDYGKMSLSSGKSFRGDEKINQGYQTSQDARFYATSRSVGAPVTNDGKDLVVSLSVKHEQGLDCGGGYIKLFHDTPASKFDGDTAYHMMFGPDQCGMTRRVHLIFNYNGTNLLWKKEPSYPDDKLTHVYTVAVRPDNTYKFYIDQEEKEGGKLEDDWSFLAPREIDDPEDTKPKEWVDESQMDDPEDKKPEDWDKEPKEVADEKATKPDDWDAEEDGEWEAPMVPNPKFKGEWKAKRIANPAYKGVWKPKQIANPEYKEDDKLYQIRKAVESVGIDVWQVKSGSIFDNIVIGDNLEEVNAIVDKTWKATKDAEKAEWDKIVKADADEAAEKAKQAAATDSKKTSDADADSDAKDDNDDL